MGGQHIATYAVGDGHQLSRRHPAAEAGGIKSNALPSKTTSAPPGTVELIRSDAPGDNLNTRALFSGLRPERNCHESSIPTPPGIGSEMKSVSVAVLAHTARFPTTLGASIEAC